MDIDLLLDKKQPYMKLRFFSITIALIVYTNAYSQEYAFKVLVNKGKNEVKSGANWEPVKVGASLKSADELKVTDNAYVGLIHFSGKPLEVKSAGRYRVADLSAKVGKGASVLNKYTDFILSSAQKKSNNLSATGAVHRGVDNIKVYLPRASSYVYGDTVSIQWEKDKAISPPYVVTFTSLFGDELHKVETSDNSISVSMNDAAFANENEIMVKITSKKDKKESEIHTLRKFSKAEKEKVNSAFAEIQAQTAENTALNSLIQAGFFEQNKLLVDAATAYQEAIKLEPGVQAYQEAYEAFLLRTGIKIPAKK